MISPQPQVGTVSFLPLPSPPSNPKVAAAAVVCKACNPVSPASKAPSVHSTSTMPNPAHSYSITTSSPSPSKTHHTPINLPHAHDLKMNLKASSTPLAVLSSIFLAWLSTRFMRQQHPSYFRWPTGRELGSAVSRLAAYDDEPHGHWLHHHHHRHHKVSNETICDDIPKGFPPPDTDTTSTLCVDNRGCCNFTTVQSAVDAAANMSQRRTIIWINRGIYYEKVTVPKAKPNITFQGQGLDLTAIAWNDTANSSHGTFYSGSVSVFGDDFIAKNISFMNVAPVPKPGDVGVQAVAIRVGGDRAAFWGCGFFGAQDTLHDDRGRHYFRDCYIQGSIDFIFGDGRSFYENCRITSIAAPVQPGVRFINGAVTAHGRVSGDDDTGFAFVNCSVGGTGRIWLGRAWRPFARVVFAYTSMADIIAPEGWNDFNDPAREQTIFFGEYKCSGGGANLSMRAPYVQKLNDTQASRFLDVSFVSGDMWLQPFA